MELSIYIAIIATSIAFTTDSTTDVSRMDRVSNVNTYLILTYFLDVHLNILLWNYQHM